VVFGRDVRFEGWSQVPKISLKTGRAGPGRFDTEEEIIRLPWRGQYGRAAAGGAALLRLRCAASASANVCTGYA
jgi:hypothetical protein